MTPAPLFTHCRAHNTITPGGRPCPQCAQIEEIKTLRAALKAAEREAASLRRRIRIIHSWTKP